MADDLSDVHPVLAGFIQYLSVRFDGFGHLIFNDYLRSRSDIPAGTFVEDPRPYDPRGDGPYYGSYQDVDMDRVAVKDEVASIHGVLDPRLFESAGNGTGEDPMTGASASQSPFVAIKSEDQSIASGLQAASRDVVPSDSELSDALPSRKRRRRREPRAPRSSAPTQSSPSNPNQQWRPRHGNMTSKLHFNNLENRGLWRLGDCLHIPLQRLKHGENWVAYHGTAVLEYLGRGERVKGKRQSNWSLTLSEVYGNHSFPLSASGPEVFIKEMQKIGFEGPGIAKWSNNVTVSRNGQSLGTVAMFKDDNLFSD